MFFVVKALDSPEEAQSTEELPCTNVVDGKLEWDNFSERSKNNMNFNQ